MFLQVRSQLLKLSEGEHKLQEGFFSAADSLLTSIIRRVLDVVGEAEGYYNNSECLFVRLSGSLCLALSVCAFVCLYLIVCLCLCLSGSLSIMFPKY